ncbi:MAG: class I SAM-dependent methyltransferase [Candidatus Paceibacterota bacterium]|jgi:23S rRNA (cytosine1962-C5)-methyltransferase
MTTYHLIDSGDGEKLEQFAEFVLRRPDPQALYPKRLSIGEWEKADATFEIREGKGKWNKAREFPDTWVTQFDDLSFSTTLGSFKHVGVFPEQETNWKWLKETIAKSVAEGKKVSVLNLFAYTGGATLACLSAGAEVVHVDASQGIVDVAVKNTELSGLKEKPVRWIVDDVKKFVAREIKRGNKYHGIIMDPPAFGHGPKKEVWNIEEHLVPLIQDAKELLHSESLFFLVNGYSTGFSPLAYANNIESLTKRGGQVESGELSIPEKDGKRALPAGMFARWRSY